MQTKNIKAKTASKRQRPMNNQKGQGLTEYLIILALVAVSAIGVMKVVGQNIKSQFANITYAIQGENKKARSTNVSNEQLKTKDMSDFMSGATQDEN